MSDPQERERDLSILVEKLTNEATELRGTATIAEHARKRLIIVTIIILAIALTLMLVQTVMVVRLADVQDTLECFTIPGEPCYEESQANQGRVIQRIIDGQVISDFCARDAETVQEAQTCVDETLESGSR